jgi:hypothetical protein
MELWHSGHMKLDILLFREEILMVYVLATGGGILSHSHAAIPIYRTHLIAVLNMGA